MLLATGFLTRIPVPAITVPPADFAATIRYYPIVGLLIGFTVAVVGWMGAQVDPWLGALAALTMWVGITGALHLDGLGDLADGLGAAHGDRTRLIAVMADPHIGSFGVVAIVLQLLAKLVLLHALSPMAWWPLILLPFAARIGPLVWARWLPPLKPGLGASVAGAVRYRDLIGWGAVWTGACALLPALIVTPLLIGGWALYLRHRMGGINGDAHGAGIELVETALLLILMIASRL
nr:adenosylcobinamide-GDP ribazoletransferase [Sphingomonas sp. BT553]